MIMTQGTITFDASNSCNGGDKKSGRAGQIVKGIFYAGDGFRSSGDANLRILTRSFLMEIDVITEIFISRELLSEIFQRL